MENEARKLYPSDVTGVEWAFVAPCLPLRRPDTPQRVHDPREISSDLRFSYALPMLYGGDVTINFMRSDGSSRMNAKLSSHARCARAPSNCGNKASCADIETGSFVPAIGPNVHSVTVYQ